MKKKFSIVVPIYFNESNIPHTVPRLQSVADSLNSYDVEFVFVDDGSLDHSLKLLLEFRSRDPRIKVIRLSRNFGSMNAIQAGLAAATGDCIGIIAADLQDPPELFREMLFRWEYGCKKVVLAVRTDRDESFGQRMFSNAYYYLMSRFALSQYPKGGFDFVLIDRQVANELVQIKEKNTNIMSLIYWLGHDRDTIGYVRQRRTHGKSKWTLSKKIKLFVDSFVSFSYVPIRVMSLVGLITAMVSMGYGLWAVVSKLFFHTIGIQGWTTLVVVITFLLGLIMLMLGIIGEYLWRILDESRNRPAYVVDELYD